MNLPKGTTEVWDDFSTVFEKKPVNLELLKNIGIEKYQPKDFNLLVACVNNNLVEELEFLLSKCEEMRGVGFKYEEKRIDDSLFWTTILVEAVSNGKTEAKIVEMLISRFSGSSIEESAKFVNSTAGYRRRSDIFPILPRESSISPLFACVNGQKLINKKVLKMLLNVPGIDVNNKLKQRSGHALSDMQMGQRNNLEMRFCTKGGYSLKKNDRTPMQEAYVRGDLEAVKLLYHHGAHIDQVLLKFNGRPTKNNDEIRKYFRDAFQLGVKMGWGLNNHHFFPEFYLKNYLWPLLLFSAKNTYLPVELIMIIMSFIPVEFQYQGARGRKDRIGWDEIRRMRINIKRTRLRELGAKFGSTTKPADEKERQLQIRKRGTQIIDLVEILDYFNLDFSEEKRQYKNIRRESLRIYERKRIAEGKVKKWSNFLKAYEWIDGN